MDGSTGSRRIPHILVVDAAEAVRNFVRFVLEAEGIRVLTASSCFEALDIAADFPGRIDVLVADFEMKLFSSGMDLGLVLRVLHPETRILLISGCELPEDALPEGSTWGFLLKPFTPWQLLERVGALAGLRPVGGALSLT